MCARQLVTQMARSWQVRRFRSMTFVGVRTRWPLASSSLGAKMGICGGLIHLSSKGVSRFPDSSADHRLDQAHRALRSRTDSRMPECRPLLVFGVSSRRTARTKRGTECGQSVERADDLSASGTGLPIVSGNRNQVENIEGGVFRDSFSYLGES
jgi:hypothetical protein